MKMKMKAKYFAKIKTSLDDENLLTEERSIKEVVFATNYKYIQSRMPEMPEYC